MNEFIFECMNEWMNAGINECMNEYLLPAGPQGVETACGPACISGAARGHPWSP